MTSSSQTTGMIEAALKEQSHHQADTPRASAVKPFASAHRGAALAKPEAKGH
jgi:hypothetical protein